MSRKEKLRRRTLRDLSFSELVNTDPDLANARCEYAAASPKKRRTAAECEYQSGVAEDLFDAALSRTGQTAWSKPCLESVVLALAIDPLFAPALLTVGSIEYQLGRVDAAMELFMTLVTLPKDEPDLPEVIEKAGDFLLDQDDHLNALRLYRGALKTDPDVAAYWSGASYCHAKRGAREDAVTAARKAVELDPLNHSLLNDLGWALAEDGNYKEARPVLQKAIALAPADDDLPRRNMEELEKRASCLPQPANPSK